jgi:hypothetical protein
MTQQYFTGKNALQQYAAEQTGGEERIVHKSSANIGMNRTFIEHDTNISVRSDYNRRDYDYFRPSEREGRTHAEIILQSQSAYKKVGLVKNTIDTMGDFASQGIRLQHTDPKIQKFYETWWARVKGSERSERYLNLLYRHGTVIIKKAYADISIAAEKKWKKAVGKKEKFADLNVAKRKIPLRYTFINPINVETMGGPESLFVEQPPLVLKINSAITNMIGDGGRMQNDHFCQYQKMVDKIPPELLSQIRNGQTRIPLDPELTEVFYYKKDDWDLWGTSMIDSILDDLIMLIKMKQADVAALDGAISNIRLWTLGKLGTSAQDTIIPTKAQINRVRNILANNVGGGVIDFVWGPDLTFKESESQVWRWLGSEKYEAVLAAIYEGLGIPPSLRASSGSTNTGNFLGLNTMVKRLEYGRGLLLQFWNKELAIIHKSMNFAGVPPQVLFDHMILGDEAASQQLFISLWDRDVLPTESLLEIFKRLPEVEQARLAKELELRGKSMPEKASPYHNADKAHDMAKIEKTGDIALKQAKLKSESKPKGGNSGRPLNVKETKKRKAKPIAKPSAKAFDLQLMLWANEAQTEINSILSTALLGVLNKSNARQLTEEERNNLEYVKFSVLSNLKPYQEIDSVSIASILSSGTYNIEIINSAKLMQKELENRKNRDAKIDEIRQIQVGAYVNYHNINDT